MNRRVVGQNVGRDQKLRWGNPSAVTVILTHIEKALWVSRSNFRTINAEKPPFLAVFSVFWSEMGDSNSRHPAPKAGALPTALHPDYLIVHIFYSAKTVRRATNYRSEILSHCSLGALRIALYFFLLSHCLHPPQAAAKPQPLHLDIIQFIKDKLYDINFLRNLHCFAMRYVLTHTNNTTKIIILN